MAPYIGPNGAYYPHNVNSAHQLPLNMNNDAPPNVSGNTVQSNVNLQYGGNAINDQTYYQRHRTYQNSYSTQDLRVPTINNLPYHHQLTGVPNPSMQVATGNPSAKSLYIQQQLELFSAGDSSSALPARHISEPLGSENISGATNRHENSTNTTPTSTRPKRVRTTFTETQIKELEQEFSKNPYVCVKRRLELSALLGIPDEKVKIWFQNRRMKSKKENPKPNPENIPSIGKPQPIIGQPQPIIGEPQPIIGQPQPIIGQPQPIIEQPQPIIGQPQPIIGQPQPTIGQPQPTIGQPQPRIGEPQPLNTNQKIRVNLLILEPSSGGYGSERPINSFPDSALGQIQNNMVKFSEPIGQFVTSPGSYSPSLTPSEEKIYYQNFNNNNQMQNTFTDQNNYGMANAYSANNMEHTYNQQQFISPQNNSYHHQNQPQNYYQNNYQNYSKNYNSNYNYNYQRNHIQYQENTYQGNPVVESHHYPSPPRDPKDVANNYNVPLQVGPYSSNNFVTPPSGINQSNYNTPSEFF